MTEARWTTTAGVVGAAGEAEEEEGVSVMRRSLDGSATGETTATMTVATGGADLGCRRSRRSSSAHGDPRSGHGGPPRHGVSDLFGGGEDVWSRIAKAERERSDGGNFVVLEI